MFHLPKEVMVYASNNGKKWEKIASEQVKSERVEIKLDKKTKKLKFVIVPFNKIPEVFNGAGYPPFTFLDELIFE